MHPDYAHIGSVESRVIEECAELTKDICKALRFGWDDFNPNTPERTNRMNAIGEIADVRRVVDELEQYLGTPLAQPPAVCRWTWDEYHEYYDTECGRAICEPDGGMALDEYPFCCACAKRIEVVKPIEEVKERERE